MMRYEYYAELNQTNQMWNGRKNFSPQRTQRGLQPQPKVITLHEYFRQNEVERKPSAGRKSWSVSWSVTRTLLSESCRALTAYCSAGHCARLVMLMEWRYFCRVRRCCSKISLITLNGLRK